MPEGDISIPRPQNPLAEQFDDLPQQREAGTLGMWLFLATEVLLFGGAFTGYFAYRANYPQDFKEASGHLFVSIGVANTVVLLTSSLFMALAVHAAQAGHRRATVIHVLMTIGFGVLFLILKAVEYYLDWREKLVPGVNFPITDVHSSHVALFLCFYWIMTAIHATHMVVGITVLSIIAAAAARGRYTAEYHNPVEVAGLYWHFVDIVWIFLLPTLYLVGPHVHL